MRDGQVALKDGRTVAFVDYGTPGDTAVVWCHGGPGSRIEPEVCAAVAAQAGLRLIGIDRPGYGGSTPKVGRTLGGWVADALAVLDHLRIDRFVSVGVSTGGAYALALASQSPRVIGTVACCALTDMRWQEGRAMVPGTLDVWQAPSRDAAAAVVVEQFGERGEKMAAFTSGEAIADSDRVLFADAECLAIWLRSTQEMFAQGVFGYTDDRLADGVGWGTFDVGAITCPVVVIHGSSDTMVPLAHAHHTTAIVPGATLRIVDGLGHFSILTEIPDAIGEVLALAGAVTSAAVAQ